MKKLPLYLTIWILLLIPFKIIGYGYLPPDDALRHSAKVVSGKDWSRIVVLRDDIKMDSHPGWHAILGFVHKATGFDTHSLVMFSVIALFYLLLLMPLTFLKHPESWLLALSAIAVFSSGWIFRTLLGRPYIFTMAVLMAICFVWPSLKNKKINFKAVIFVILAVALSTWIHGAWYIFVLPVIAFFLAREWRVGKVFSLCTISGIALGAFSTGHPVMFLKQAVVHFLLAFRDVSTQDLLVTEFQPGLADMGTIILVLVMLGWRALRGKWDRSAVDNPVFILAGLCGILGLISVRAYSDWAMPALAVWIALEFDGFLKEKAVAPLQRIAVTVVACMVVYLSFTSDALSRWSQFKPVEYLSYENPGQRPWLPDPGGIIYSDDMSVFYSTFYKNPKADWRYVLGFEPGLMPPDDLATLRSIQKNSQFYANFYKDFRLYRYYYPWVKKMRPQDRLILRGSPDAKPKIPELEWNYAAYSIWIGRIPKH